jgi:transcriptional regulator with XRE-family HTH domain
LIFAAALIPERGFLLRHASQSRKALMTSAQLRELRLSAGLSQADLGTALRISASAISQAERGVTQLTDEHAAEVWLVVERHKKFLEKTALLASHDEPTTTIAPLRLARTSPRG